METEFARQYYEAARSDHWWFKGRADLVDRIVRRYDLPVGLTLDLGAGSESLFPTTFPVVKLDIVKPEGQLGHFVRGSAVSLPFGDRSFSGIGAFDLIEHVAEADVALKEAWRVLLPGGFFLAMVPAHQRLWSPHDERVGHVTRYNQPQLMELVAAAGFEVAWCSSFYGFLLGPAVIRTLFHLDTGVGSPRPFVNRWLSSVAVRSARRAEKGSRLGLSIGILAFRD